MNTSMKQCLAGYMCMWACKYEQKGIWQINKHMPTEDLKQITCELCGMNCDEMSLCQIPVHMSIMYIGESLITCSLVWTSAVNSQLAKTGAFFSPCITSQLFPVFQTQQITFAVSEPPRIRPFPCRRISVFWLPSQGARCSVKLAAERRRRSNALVWRSQAEEESPLWAEMRDPPPS